MRIFESDPPLPGSVGKEGRNDFHDHPLSYGYKAPFVDDDPLSSFGVLSAGGKVSDQG